MSSPVDTRPNPFADRFMDDEDRSPEGVQTSNESSQPGSAGGRNREKKRVGFTTGGESGESNDRRVSWIDPSDETYSPKSTSGYVSPEHSGSNTPGGSRRESLEYIPHRNISKSHLPELSPQQTAQIHEAFNLDSHLETPGRPRPAMRRGASTQGHLADEDIEGPDVDGQREVRRTRMREAFERGKRHEETTRSENNSRYTSPERHQRRGIAGDHPDDIQLQEFGRYHDGQNDWEEDEGLEMPAPKRARKLQEREAQRLVRSHTKAHSSFVGHVSPSGFRSGTVTPTEEQHDIEDYRPRPNKYRGGILGSLMQLYNNPQEGFGSHSRSSSMTNLLHGRQHSSDVSATPTPQHSPPDSGTVTPTGKSSGRHWYSRKKKNGSTTSLSRLIGTSASLGSPAVSGGLAQGVTKRLKEHQREQAERSHSSTALAALNRVRHRDRKVFTITNHIAETLARHKYLMQLCEALMKYGAPTHRLEEYMAMSARVLKIQAQFLYIPGSMIMSFDDEDTHTTEVKLVKVVQGLDLGRLRDAHEVYKDVVHDQIGVEEATQRLKEIRDRNPKHSVWVRIPFYGLAAVSVGPFAFQARPIDFPIAFILGCILGLLQLKLAPSSDLFANVFEISAAVITSFLARAFGSISHNGHRIFCFSALAQSSIALILPGYIVLCASLELQSKSIVAGSVRMVYAIIYSLFLGFGIMIGTAIYGILDANATSATTCEDPISDYWFFFAVPVFALCLIVINQAKWKQAPVMLFIAFAGYMVSYWSSKRFAGNTQVSSTLGAFTIGVLANGYSRVGSKIENWALDRWEDDLRPHWRRFRKRYFHTQSKAQSAKSLEEGSAADDESIFVRQGRRVGYSLAAAAMLPAIFVQVPSGLAVSGSLVSGLASANQIAGNATNGTQVVNTTALASGSDNGLNSIAFNVSYSVVQVAIGITVGLFLSALVVYPVGKRRSGLFAF